MIVVAIIGILAAIAIPAYQGYVARAQAAEAMELMGGAKMPLTEYYSDHGVWPTDPIQIGINTAGRYVIDSAEFVAGQGTSALTLTMLATFRSSDISRLLMGRQLTLETTDGGKTWACRPATTNGVNPSYLPSACR
jgi:type IV pilus assembly protein PilA